MGKVVASTVMGLFCCRFLLQVDGLLNGYDSRLNRQTSYKQRKRMSRHFSGPDIGGFNSSSSFISSYGSEVSETILSISEDSRVDVSHFSKSPGNEVPSWNLCISIEGHCT